MCKGQLDNGEDWMEAAEVGRENEMVCTMTNALVNDERRCDSLMVCW
jgi:hypothetical protein